MAFSETEHLIALTGMPQYKIQVWYWRTHDLLISEDSDMITDKQRITCSSSLPLTVAQFAHTRGKLIVWEVHGTQKFCKLIKRKIALDFEKNDGPFQDVYSIEGNIQIVNRHGDIYYVIPSSGSVNLIAKWNGERGDNSSCVAYIRNGILVAGSDGTLKYFKRQKYVWNEIFQAPTPAPFAMLKGYHDNETVIGTTINGGLFKIVLSEVEKINIANIKQFDPAYVFFALVNPVGDHVIAVDTLNAIRVMSTKTGDKVATIDIVDQTIIQSNPRYPFVAIGNSSGDVTFVSLFDPQQPKVLTEFLLSRRSIVNMRFSDGGQYLVAIDSDYNFFIIRCVPGEKMTILHYFKESINVVEFFIIESRTKLDIMLLCATNDEAKWGERLLKITVQLDDVDNDTRQEWTLTERYTSIISIFGATDQFYAIRYGVRHIEVLGIDDEGSLELTAVIETPHQMRHIEAYNDGNHLVTWSVDGIAATYDLHNGHEVLAAFVANNRHNCGVRIAQCDAKCELMVTLDQLGNLICSKMTNAKPSKADQNYEDAALKANEKIAEMFSLTTSGGFPGISIEHYGKKFTDLKSEQTYQMEARESEQTRKLLFSKLASLRTNVKKMLDENEQMDDDEKLEILDFNLDLITTAQKEMEASEERNNEEKRMMDYIEAQTAMNNWIIDKCWSPMEVNGAKLRGMFISLFVDNYPLLAEENGQQMKRIKLMRAIENSVSREDSFLPWRPIPTMCVCFKIS